MKKALFLFLLVLGISFSSIRAGANQIELENIHGSDISFSSSISGLYLETDVLNDQVLHGTNIPIRIKIIDYSKNSSDYVLRFSSSEITSSVASGVIFTGDSIEFTVQTIKTGYITIEFSVSRKGKENQSNTTSTEVYVVAETDFDFASSVSISAAQEVQYFYLVGIDVIDDSEQEYSRQVFNSSVTSESIEEDKILMMPMSSKLISIRGYVYWKDTNDVSQPAKGLKVEICDLDIFGLFQIVATTYTDESGYYNATFINDDSILENGGYDIFRRFRTDTQTFEVVTQSNNPYIHSMYHDGDENGNPEIYMNIPNGTIDSKIHTFGLNDNNGNPSDTNRAISVHQAIWLAQKYAEVSTNQLFTNLRVNYPGDSSGAYYQPWNDLINIPNTHFSSWDVIMHEYGHFVQDILDFTDSPGGFHYINTNLADDRSNKSEGVRLSWGEAWASYFGLTAQIVLDGGSSGIPGVGDRVYDNLAGGWSYDFGNLPTGQRFGEAGEGTIVAFLFDIVDDLGLDYGYDWAIIDIYAPDTFSEFLNGFTNEYTINQTVLGVLLSYYRMAPDTLTVTNDSRSAFYPPTLSWVARGGSTLFPNNSFVLKIDAPNGINLYTINVGTSTSYTLTNTQWQTLLRDGYAYSNWYVIADQTNTPITGSYRSQMQSLSEPSVQSVSTNTNYSGSLVTGGMRWYKFTAPSTGTYKFFTTGSTNTYGEFFNQIVAGQSTTGRLYYDDNSGDGYNFMRTITLSQGQTIYIRVRGSGWTSTGSFVFRVELESTHTHTYGQYYSTHNIVYHRLYCSCGGYILEQHNWIMIPYDDGVNVGLQQYCPECGQLGLVMLMYRGELGDVLYNTDFECLNCDDHDHDCVECYNCSHDCDECSCSFEEYITEQFIQEIKLEYVDLNRKNKFEV